MFGSAFYPLCSQCGMPMLLHGSAHTPREQQEIREAAPRPQAGQVDRAIGDRAQQPGIRQTWDGLRARLGPEDSVGVYSMDEALGSVAMLRLWLRANHPWR